MDPKLKDLLGLSYSFAGIDRDLIYPDRERPENDAEHAFQLELLAWHIIEHDKLPLDSAKVFKLCMAHDLVEVYSGDVPLWGKSGHDEKVERERQALETIKQNFPYAKDMADTIAEYKDRKTPEALFVYALDKLAPFLNQLNTDGFIWKKHNVTIEQALAKLEVSANISEFLKKYFDESIEYMKENKDRFF